jgi:hypothetical protein
MQLQSSPPHPIRLVSSIPPCRLASLVPAHQNTPLQHHLVFQPLFSDVRLDMVIRRAGLEPYCMWALSFTGGGVAGRVRLSVRGSGLTARRGIEGSQDGQTERWVDNDRDARLAQVRDGVLCGQLRVYCVSPDGLVRGPA